MISSSDLLKAFSKTDLDEDTTLMVVPVLSEIFSTKMSRVFYGYDVDSVMNGEMLSNDEITNLYDECLKLICEFGRVHEESVEFYRKQPPPPGETKTAASIDFERTLLAIARLFAPIAESYGTHTNRGIVMGLADSTCGVTLEFDDIDWDTGGHGWSCFGNKVGVGFNTVHDFLSSDYEAHLVARGMFFRELLTRVSLAVTCLRHDLYHARFDYEVTAEAIFDLVTTCALAVGFARNVVWRNNIVVS